MSKIEDILSKMQTLQQGVDVLAAKLEVLKAELKETIVAEHGEFADGDFKEVNSIASISWVTPKNATKFQEALFKEENAELWKQYYRMNTKPSTPTFRITYNK